PSNFDFITLVVLHVMFPLYDFNVVCCALATVSAAVGYRYSRRNSQSHASWVRPSDIRSAKDLFFGRDGTVDSSCGSSTVSESDSSDVSVMDCPTPSAPPADVTEPGSLKRKNREYDGENLDSQLMGSSLEGASSPPRKRCRTPSADDTVVDEPTVLDVGTTGSDSVASPFNYSACETNEVLSQPDSMGQTPTAQAVVASPEPASLTPVHSSMPSAFTIPVCKPSSAFAAFIGVSTGFRTSETSTSGLSNPAWRSGSTITPVHDTPLEDTLQVSSGKTGSEPTQPTEAPATARAVTGVVPDPLAASEHTGSTHIVVTGEEDEEVKAELKGVKLFIKRGGKEFSSGMLGHVKLLSHNNTHEDRLVFRRELVLKVAMSATIRPAVRCTFDEEQGILRVALKETVKREDAVDPGVCQQVVVYALKVGSLSYSIRLLRFSPMPVQRGKSSREDFANFAKAVMGSPQLTAPPVVNAATSII
ncbi:hypothetical protein PHLCEN_2v11057, partial [Hermanssonia centrifuga]